MDISNASNPEKPVSEVPKIKDPDAAVDDGTITATRIEEPTRNGYAKHGCGGI
jgi:hypothetical protein